MAESSFRKATDEPVRLPHRVSNLYMSRCGNCEDLTIWVSDAVVFPVRGAAPPPNPDLPDDIRRDYGEANAILQLSPRGAAALLRLAIQKLCSHLGERGKNVNEDIGKLVEKGLDSRVQRALDIVRVTGNEAVHPGQIDLKDDVEMTQKLFGLVNMIADIMISQPKGLDKWYNSLPEPEQVARPTQGAATGFGAGSGA